MYHAGDGGNNQIALAKKCYVLVQLEMRLWPCMFHIHIPIHFTSTLMPTKSFISKILKLQTFIMNIEKTVPS